MMSLIAIKWFNEREIFKKLPNSNHIYKLVNTVGKIYILKMSASIHWESSQIIPLNEIN